MEGQWLPAAGVQSLEKYLVSGEEKLVFVVRRHWITLAEPVATTIASGAVMVLLVWALGQKLPDAANIIFMAWLVVVGRLIVRLIEWRESWFGSTQRRLMLIHGLVVRKVAMMPLEKVTDMSYARSPMGQLFGYGEFVLESAGQEQALRSVAFLPHPDDLYRALLSTMFARTSKPAAEKAPGKPTAAATANAAVNAAAATRPTAATATTPMTPIPPAAVLPTSTSSPGIWDEAHEEPWSDSTEIELTQTPSETADETPFAWQENTDGFARSDDEDTAPISSPPLDSSDD